ncbi:MAG: hypothetical protein ACI9T7_000216 [Oleiphilaceae bacterium]|jgi:hypothetical protein
MKKISSYLFSFFTVFAAFFPIGTATYLISPLGIKVRLTTFQWFLILASFMMLLSKLMSYGNYRVILITFFLYFGFIWLLPLFKVFKIYNLNYKLIYFFYFLVFLVLLEGVLVNSIVSPTSLLNYPDVDGMIGQTHINTNGYQRPYSFGANTTVTSTILIVLASMITLGSFGWIALLFSIIILQSATGMLLFITLISVKLFFSIKSNVVRFFSFIIILSLPILIFKYLDYINARLNSDYVFVLIDFKLNQIYGYFHGYTPLEYIFGRISNLDSSQMGSYGYKGDFGWIEVFLGYGFAGFMIIISFMLTYINRENIIPMMLLIIGTLHYGVIHTIVGQFTLLLVFFYNQKNINH